jgi:flagellar hook protein FlgE
MAFQQGLSGLNMAAKALDAVGNNIANAQTVGFKSAAAQFNDVYAAAIGGSTSSGTVGQGGGIMGVAQNFSQGNVSSTNNPLDIAINGNGFLRFQPTLTDQTPMYSRNGQLHLNSEGYIVNAQDQFLNAFLSPDGTTLDQSSASPLQLSSSQLEPRATGYSNTLVPGAGGIEIGLNFDVRDSSANMNGNTVDSEWTALQTWDKGSAADFAGLNPNMYNYSTSATVYDQRGEPHILTMYFARQGVDDGTGEFIGGTSWQPYFVLDSNYVITTVTTNGANPTDPPVLEFNANGQLNTNNNGALYTLDLTTAIDAVGNTVDLTASPLQYFPDAATEPTYALTIDFGTATQFGSAYDVNKLTQDGYGPGRLSGVSIDSDGQIMARYSNGQTKLTGQVALTTFQNANGLVPLGNNMWAETAASGQPLLGSPQSGSRGAIQAGAVEDANVDLTAELVNMITLQRAYQANAQTIRTQDEVLQTLVNLR